MMRLAVIALMLGIAPYLGARAGAQGVDANRIFACVSTAGGKLRIVEAGAACKRRERALDWAVAGVPGTPGPTGPQGDPGAPGSALDPCRDVGRLTVPGIMGEGAGGTIAVLHHSAGVQANGDPAGGPPTFSELKVIKRLDKASPELFQAAVAGTPLPPPASRSSARAASSPRSTT